MKMNFILEVGAPQMQPSLHQVAHLISDLPLHFKWSIQKLTAEWEDWDKRGWESNKIYKAWSNLEALQNDSSAFQLQLSWQYYCQSMIVKHGYETFDIAQCSTVEQFTNCYSTFHFFEHRQTRQKYWLFPQKQSLFKACKWEFSNQTTQISC